MTKLKNNTTMFAPFEWMMAFRYLRARRKEGFISLIAVLSFIGIMLGVATLIIVMAVMNGFRQELYAKILGLNGHVIVHKVGRPFTDFDQVGSRIRKLEKVQHVLPLIEGQVMVSTKQLSNGAFLRGMRGDDIKKLASLSNKIRYGSLNGFDQSKGLAIGIRMANQLGVGIGDGVTVIAPRGVSTPFGTSPRIKRYPVVAIFEIGMSEYDSNFLFMPLSEAQLFFNKKKQVNVLEVVIDDPENVDELSPFIKEAGGEFISLTNWRQRNTSFFDALQVERNVMFLILTLIILVAALNIISSLIMLVKDKHRDIAVMRTMGASKWAVMRIFFITGASIGVSGTIAGLLLGILVCQNIEIIQGVVNQLTGVKINPEVHYLASLPAKMDVKETFSVVMMGLGLSFLATLYPSWRASCLDPVEALRYE